MASSNSFGEAGAQAFAAAFDFDVGAEAANFHLDAGGNSCEFNFAPFAGGDGFEAVLDLCLQAVGAEEELRQERHPGLLAGGDEVQFLFHFGREGEVDEFGEVALQEADDGEGRECGDKCFALAGHVPAVLDGLEDCRVRAGPADARLYRSGP